MMPITQEQIRNLDKLIISSFYKLSQHHSGITASEIIEYLRQRFGDVWNVRKLTTLAEKTLDRSAELGLINKRDAARLKCPKCKITLTKSKSRPPARRRRLRRPAFKRRPSRRRRV